MPRLTFFTAPKPFEREHIILIQRNAIRSWLRLGDAVEVVLIGDEAGIAETAHELGAKHVAEFERNAHGTPRLDSIFRQAEAVGRGEIMVYLNADVIALPDLAHGALAVARQCDDYLIVGQRWDLDLTRELEFGPGWPDELLAECRREGRRHARGGSDYFIYPRGKFADLPAFALGRAGWDNWMIYAGRRSGAPVVDGSRAINVIHQTHDYGHLTGGRPHYQHPESFENLKLAGGDKVIFALDDANRVLVDGQLAEPPATWKRFWREVEIAALVKGKSNFLAELSYLVFHPIKAYWKLRGRLAGIKKRILPSG